MPSTSSGRHAAELPVPASPDPTTSNLTARVCRYVRVRLSGTLWTDWFSRNAGHYRLPDQIDMCGVMALVPPCEGADNGGVDGVMAWRRWTLAFAFVLAGCGTIEDAATSPPIPAPTASTTSAATPTANVDGRDRTLPPRHSESADRRHTRNGGDHPSGHHGSGLHRRDRGLVSRFCGFRWCLGPGSRADARRQHDHHRCHQSRWCED